MSKTRILIVEPHPVVVMGLRQLVQQQPDMEVVGHCHEAANVLETAAKFQPDLVVIDTAASGLGGVELSQALLEAMPTVKIVAFADLEERTAVVEILNAGASAYILKRSMPEEIIHALRLVAAGENYVQGNLLRSLCPTDREKLGLSLGKGRNELTGRESTVLRLVAEGHVAREIAVELSVSAKSVETYKTRGMKKLGLISRPDVVRYASRQGWLERLRRERREFANCTDGAALSRE
jgi:two-component system nitrate/nitrite response regulator NarL